MSEIRYNTAKDDKISDEGKCDLPCEKCNLCRNSARGDGLREDQYSAYGQYAEWLSEPSSTNCLRIGLMQSVIRSLENILFVSDPETCSIVWMNNVGLDALGIEDIRALKCREIFSGMSREACEICRSRSPKAFTTHREDIFDMSRGRHFCIKSRMFTSMGRTLRLSSAEDCGYRVLNIERMRIKLEDRNDVIDVILNSMATDTLSRAIGEVLAKAGAKSGADGVCMFETDFDENGNLTAHHVQEWLSGGTASIKHELQHVRRDMAEYVFRELARGGTVLCRDISETAEMSPWLHEICLRNGVRNFYIEPMILGGRLNGAIALYNIKEEKESFEMLHVAASFLAMEMSRRRGEERTREIAMRDALTGVRNRDAMMNKIKEIRSEPRSRIGVAVIDLNAMKAVNDTYGHSAGDSYLKAMGSIFSGCVGDSNVYRIGGDEFVLILCDISSDKFKEKMNELRKCVWDRFPGSISMGEVWSDDSRNADNMIEEADREMYIEKKRLHTSSPRGSSEHIKEWKFRTGGDRRKK